MDDCTLELVPPRHLRPHGERVGTSPEHNFIEMHYFLLAILFGDVNVPPCVSVVSEHHTNCCIKPNVLM
jgi:hypothetical protein